MSIPFYSNIDLTKNQLLNAVFQNLPSAPSNPKEGQFYYNSTDKALYYWDGVKWVDSSYLLPIATASTLGGVKIGTGINISADGTISVDPAERTVVVDNLTTTTKGAALDASQGKILKDMIDAINLTLANLGTAAEKDVGTGAGEIPLLDSTGKLNPDVIPAISVLDVFEAASDSEMLALDAHEGDICIRTDSGSIYILKQTPANVLANWIPIEIPITVTSVNGQTGAVVLEASDIEYAPGVTIAQILGKIRNDFIVAIGDNTNTSYTVNHNFGTSDVFCELYEVATGQTVYTDITRASVNSVRLDFGKAPTLNQFRLMIRKAVV